MSANLYSLCLTMLDAALFTAAMAVPPMAVWAAMKLIDIIRARRQEQRRQAELKQAAAQHRAYVQDLFRQIG